MKSHYLLLPLLFALAACAQITGDKYPFPPQFVKVEDVCACCLGSPPAPNSAIEKNEIVSILLKQKSLNAKEKSAIMAEDHISPSMIIDPVLGGKYTESTHPALFMLMRHAASDAWRIGDSAQDEWKRTRPWLTDSRVQLLVSSIKRPSYPSGHSTTNHVWAHVLSELFPKKHDAFFKRAHEIGMHRVAAGVHYPSDVEAGKRFAATIYQVMKKNAAFKAELAAARAELKSPAAANDNMAVPHVKVSNCNTPEPGMSMTMCR